MMDYLRPLYQRYRHGYERRYAADVAAGRPLTFAELDGVLDHLGINAGDHLLVHSRSAVIGQIEGGLIAVVNWLKKRITPSGLLLMPSFPFEGRSWDYAQTDPIFDVRRSPSLRGLLTEVFRRLPGTERSLHPTHPVTIWGNRAREWTVGHEIDAMPFHRDSPYGRLYREGGKVLFLELDGFHLTQVHAVEGILRDRFPVPVYVPNPVPMRVIDHHGVERALLALPHDPRATSRTDVRRFYPELERRGTLHREWLRGYLPFVAIDVVPMMDYFLDLARRGITVYNKTTWQGHLRGLLAQLTTDAPRAELLAREPIAP
jgi:aminoglycoside N3'-acetyltransferase